MTRERVPAVRWVERAERLAALLVERGDLHDPAWRAAIAEVPRHALVPTALRQDGTGSWQPVDVTSPVGLDLVYSPETLITAVEDRDGRPIVVSSSTKPDLMVRMLEVLDIRDGHTVLEIGTGTGYNAALLSHRLGSERVFSMHIEPGLVDRARGRLASIGHRPTLAVADGHGGLPGHGPCDRIIATCSVPAVPWPWARQLAPDGRILLDLKTGSGAGNLALLGPAGPDRVQGRFTERWAAFMQMRHRPGPAAPVPDAVAVSESAGRRRTSCAPAQPWSSHRVAWFLAQPDLPADVHTGLVLYPDGAHTWPLSTVHTAVPAGLSAAPKRPGPRHS